MPRNIDDVVNASPDPVVSFVISTSSVSCELIHACQLCNKFAPVQTHIISFVYVQIRIHISFMCAPDGASHAGPWLFDGQNALDIVAKYLFTGNRVDDGRLNSKEWQRRTSRFCRSDPAKGRYNMGASLGLPVSLSSNQHDTASRFE